MAELCQPDATGDFRCLCGNLLARLVPGGVELKCRRCRRSVVVALADTESQLDSTGTAPPDIRR